jgi:hypothetical protein
VCEVEGFCEVKGVCAGMKDTCAKDVLDMRFTGTGGLGFAAGGGEEVGVVVSLGCASGGTTGYVGGGESKVAGVCGAEGVG